MPPGKGGDFSALSAPIIFSVALVRVQIMYIDLQRLQRVKNNLPLLVSRVTGVCADREWSIAREQGWRSGDSARLPPMRPGFNFRRRRHMWVKFVVGSLPCQPRPQGAFPCSLAPRGFSLGTPVFPSPQKPTLPNSNSIWNSRTRLNEFI